MTRCNPFENTKYEKAEKTIHFLQKGDFGTMSLIVGIPIESIAK